MGEAGDRRRRSVGQGSNLFRAAAADFRLPQFAMTTDTEDRTHWEGCHTAHLDCAILMIVTLEAERDALLKWQERARELGMSTLGEDYPKEQERLRELIQVYAQIPSRAFGKMMIEHALKKADEAAISGDLPRMIAEYKAMKEFE